MIRKIKKYILFLLLEINRMPARRFAINTRLERCFSYRSPGNMSDPNKIATSVNKNILKRYG